MFVIEKNFELADPTIIGFLWFRIAMVIEFILIPLPVVLLIVKVMEWSGDYLVLVLFLTTALVKVLLMYVHPMLISPLFSHFEELGEWADGLKGAI